MPTGIDPKNIPTPTPELKTTKSPTEELAANFVEKYNADENLDLSANEEKMLSKMLANDPEFKKTSDDFSKQDDKEQKDFLDDLRKKNPKTTAVVGAMAAVCNIIQKIGEGLAKAMSGGEVANTKPDVKPPEDDAEKKEKEEKLKDLLKKLLKKYGLDQKKDAGLSASTSTPFKNPGETPTFTKDN